MNRAVTIIILLLGTLAARAQVGVHRFVITACPMQSKVDKDAFNLQHAHVTDDEDFHGILRKTFGTTLDGRVRYERHVHGGPTEFWVYNIPTARSTRVALATMASKGTEKEMVQNRTELRQLLVGTVVLHEELRIRVRLADADFPANGYYLLWTDPADGTVKRTPVPAARDTLILLPSLFGPQPPRTLDVRLRNKAKPGTDLAEGRLRILTPDERDELRDIACEGARRHHILAPDSIALLALQLSELFHGRTHPSGIRPPDCTP